MTRFRPADRTKVLQQDLRAMARSDQTLVRRGVLPQPAPATAISGSPFLFLPKVEFLIYDSSHEFSNGNTFSLGNLFQRRFLRFREIDIYLFVLHDG